MTIAEVAQVAYIEAQIRIDDFARDLTAKAPLKAAKYRHYAAIAYRAAKAEADNPEPDEVRPCHVCAGIRVCDWDAHRVREYRA